MIDFTFTEEQEMFRKAAREIAETKIAPKIAEMEETGEVSEDVVKALAEGEMMAITDKWRQPLQTWKSYFKMHLFYISIN